MKLENNWRFKSLQNLEKIKAADLTTTSDSYLVKRFSNLITIPLNEYTTEDLRLMIGQRFGLSYLVPLAIDKLAEDLFAEGDYYPGDLLSNVLKISDEFWLYNSQLFNDVNKLIVDRKEEIKEAGISLSFFGK